MSMEVINYKVPHEIGDTVYFVDGDKVSCAGKIRFVCFSRETLKYEFYDGTKKAVDEVYSTEAEAAENAKLRRFKVGDIVYIVWRGTEVIEGKIKAVIAETYGDYAIEVNNDDVLPQALSPLYLKENDGLYSQFEDAMKVAETNWRARQIKKCFT